MVAVRVLIRVIPTSTSSPGFAVLTVVSGNPAVNDPVAVCTVTALVATSTLVTRPVRNPTTSHCDGAPPPPRRPPPPRLPPRWARSRDNCGTSGSAGTALTRGPDSATAATTTKTVT